MSKYHRPHRHERRQQHAVKARVEYLKSETDFAPNKPRTKSIVTVESTERAKFGRAHIANALRRGEYHNANCSDGWDCVFSLEPCSHIKN
jgi:hypothetical protein